MKLPLSWAVHSSERDNPNYKIVMDYINFMCNKNFKGTDMGSYYGIDRGKYIIVGDVDKYNSINGAAVKVITVKEFMDCEIPPLNNWAIQGDYPELLEYANVYGTKMHGGYTQDSVADYHVFHFPAFLMCDKPVTTASSTETGYRLISKELFIYKIYKLFKERQMTKLEQKETLQTEQLIRREDFREIINVACSEWKKKLIEKAKYTDVLSSVIRFTNIEVREMFKASSDSQKIILRKFFTEEIDNNPIREKKANCNLIENFSGYLFGQLGDQHLQILAGETPTDRPELSGRALYVTAFLEVELGKTSSGGTFIAFKEK